MVDTVLEPRNSSGRKLGGIREPVPNLGVETSKQNLLTVVLEDLSTSLR
jgi:hypothetical protein